MGKGFGIAALIVAILAFFVPIYGFVGSWLALKRTTSAIPIRLMGAPTSALFL